MKALNPRVLCYNAMFLEDETNLHSCAGVRLGNLGLPHEACENTWAASYFRLSATWQTSFTSTITTTLHNLQMKRLTPASVQLQAVGGHLVLQLGGPVLGHRGQLVPALARLQHRARPQQPDCCSPRAAPCTGRWKLSPRRCWSSPQQACAGTKTITTQAQIDMNILILLIVFWKLTPKGLILTTFSSILSCFLGSRAGVKIILNLKIHLDLKLSNFRLFSNSASSFYRGPGPPYFWPSSNFSDHTDLQ